MSSGLSDYENVNRHGHDGQIGIGGKTVVSVVDTDKPVSNLGNGEVMDRPCKTGGEPVGMVASHSGSDINCVGRTFGPECKPEYTEDGKGNCGADGEDVNGQSMSGIYDKPTLGLRIILPKDKSSKGFGEYFHIKY